MNVHRKDRAKLRQAPDDDDENLLSLDIAKSNQPDHILSKDKNLCTEEEDEAEAEDKNKKKKMQFSSHGSTAGRIEVLDLELRLGPDKHHQTSTDKTKRQFF
ncbi:hypothetical protein JCGZ_09120 [Jatropha curcas]|uniref:Uncharacterized protein n=2 Tax=Jatropha curcas TaxID=180498 RepID=A0A067KHT6_JATCU|nr:hypothetical protein JCGZ_09120 [Jatropha curcas]